MDRKEFTKRCLADALIELLKVKEFNDISINDITTKSGFSRMSYYRNFDSQLDILDYYLDHQTKEYIEKSNIDFDSLTLEEYLIKLFTFLGREENREVATLLMKRGLFFRIAKEFDVRFNAKQKNDSRDYYYAFISGGTFSAYRLWVVNGYREAPEEIVHSFLEFTHYQERHSK